MIKSRKILASVLALVMIFSNTYNILPSLAINNVTNGIIQLPTTTVRPYNIITVGDSITFGAFSTASNTTNGSSSTFNYPKQLGTLLNEYVTANTTNIPSFTVTNKGENGRTMLPTTSYPYINTGKYTDTCNTAKDTDAIIIMLGTNDAKGANWVDSNGKTAVENYSIAAKAMVDRFKISNPNVRIIFATALKGLGAATGTGETIQASVVNGIVAPLQRELAIINGWELVDINRLSKDWTLEQAGDTIHPDEEDYHFIAEWMRDAINDDGTKSSSFKVEAVKDFIAALPADTAITSENVSSNATLYNRAKKTYDMLTATEKTSVGDITKLTAAKAKIQTLMGDTSLVTVTNSRGLATSSGTLAKADEIVTITASKVAGYRFDKWVVSAGSGITLADYKADITTFTKGTAAVNIQATYKSIDKVAPTATTFTASNQFTFPTDENFKEFEAESLELDHGTTATANQVEIINDRSSSNDKTVNNFKSGNKLKLYYNAAQAGEYTVGITYRSSLTFGRGIAAHGFNISGTKVDPKYVTVQTTMIDSRNPIFYYEDYFTINIKETGDGIIDIAASAANGPVIDKFNIRKLDSYVINAVGDSITFGSVADFSGTYESYSHILQQMLNSKIASGEITDKANIIVDNCGVGSASMMDNSTNTLPYKVDNNPKQMYLKSLSNKADATIVMLGTNDAYGTNWTTKNGLTPEKSYEDSCDAMMAEYKASNPNMEIFMATSPYAVGYPLIQNAVVPLQRTIAGKNKYYIIDIAEKTSNWSSENYWTDNLHPNAKGHRLLANYMLDGLMNKVEANTVALASLASTVTWSSVFNPQITAYKGATSKSNITITATANSATDTITIDKGTANIVPVTAGTVTSSIPLTMGENIIKITVTSQGHSKVYIITVTRDDALYVSDLDWVASHSGWDGTTVKRDYSPKEGMSEPIRINTAATGAAVASPIYKKGVGMHSGASNAPGYLVVKIPTGVKKFKSNIGISYSQLSSAAPMTFRVYWGTDGTTFDATAIYTSAMTRAGTNFAVIDIDVPTDKSYMKLELAAPSGNNVSSAHGNWADAKFTIDTTTPLVAVNEVEFSLTAPVKESPQTVATVAESANYTAMSTVWKSGAALHTGAFNAGVIYSAEVVLFADSGFKFADVVTVKGDTSSTYTVTVSEDKSVVTLKKTFESTMDNVALKAGDIDGNATFDIADALVALKVATTIIAEPTGNKFINGNVDNTTDSINKIDKADIIKMLNNIINGVSLS